MNDWLNTTSDEEAAEQSKNFWASLSESVKSGEFWADRIKGLRSEPAKRLGFALKNLPLPAAFREAAIAIRAIIKAKKKENENFEEPLALLYWLAAIYSFMIPYASRLQEPGYNVVESMPGSILKSLPFNYLELGIDKLELLTKTDRKQMVQLWGEPKFHKTLNEIHRTTWDEYESKLIKRRELDRRKMWDLLR